GAAKSEVLRLGLLRRHCYLLGLLAVLLVPCHYGVVARRQALYRISAVGFKTHRIEWMRQHADVGFHPGMLVALHGNQSLRPIEFLLYRGCPRRLGLVPLLVLARRRMHVMCRLVAVDHFQILPGLNTDHVRVITATLLIENHVGCRSRKTVLVN